MFFTPAFWLQNNLGEKKFKRWFCTQKPVWNSRFKDIWYTKNKNKSDSDLVWQIQLIAFKVKNPQHTQNTNI